MNKIQQLFSRLMKSNGFLKIFSIIMAFVVWLIVVIFIDPNTTVTVRGVPIDLESQTAALSRLGFNIISTDPTTVNVEIHGKGYVVGQIKPEELKIQPRVTSASAAGTQDLVLQWVSDGNEDYTVNGISPASTTVRIDRMITNTINIDAHVSGVDIAEGYIKEEEIVTPDKVTLTGPAADINRVAHAIVNIEVNKTLSATETVSSEILLMDSDGNPVDQQHIQSDYDIAQVAVPVLKVRDVPLRLDFINTPVGFPLDMLSYTLSNESIRVAGPQTLVDSYNEILLGYVDFKTLEAGAKLVYDVELPSGFDNVDNILSVSVEFETDDFVSQSFNLSQVNVVNAPQNYDVRVVSPYLKVKMVGPADTVAAMTGEDLVAEIDFSDREAVTGQIKMPVRVYAPDKGTVWAVGEYVTLVEISEK